MPYAIPPSLKDRCSALWTRLAYYIEGLAGRVADQTLSLLNPKMRMALAEAESAVRRMLFLQALERGPLPKPATVHRPHTPPPAPAVINPASRPAVFALGAAEAKQDRAPTRPAALAQTKTPTPPLKTEARLLRRMEALINVFAAPEAAIRRMRRRLAQTPPHLPYRAKRPDFFIEKELAEALYEEAATAPRPLAAGADVETGFPHNAAAQQPPAPPTRPDTS
jgi:hypothetical protein